MACSVLQDPFDLKRLRYSFKNLLEKLESFKPSTRQEREEKVKQPKMENSKKMKRKKWFIYLLGVSKVKLGVW